MSWTIFFFRWTSRISRCFLSANFFQTESRVSCPREFRKVFRKRCRQCRNRDQYELGVKELFECEERSSATFEWYRQLRKSRIGSELCFIARQEIYAKVSWHVAWVTVLFALSVLIILLCTTSCTDIIAECRNESKPLRYFARRTLLWPSGRAKSPIEVSSEHAPINFSSGKDSFNTDFNDLATTVVASAITAMTEVGQFESIRCVWFSAASCSQRQPASSSVVNLWQDTDLRSTGNFVRGVESFPSVERTMSKGRRDIFSAIKGENSVWTGKLSWILWQAWRRFFKESLQLRKDYLWLRLKLDRKQCERRNGDIVLFETCGQLESQRVEFYQAKQLTTELAIWRIRDEK